MTVGYNLRFYKPLRKVKELLEQNTIGKVYGARAEFGFYLPEWRPTQDYRKNYGAIKEQGGGVILDVIHEINYLKWLLGDVDEVFCYGGKLSDLEMDTEDFAAIVMKMKKGTILNLHLDYLQRSYRRNCQVIGEKGTIIWDFTDHSVMLYEADKKEWQTFKWKDMDFNETYLEEEKNFLQSIEGESELTVTGEEAKQDLKIALAALDSSDKNTPIKL